MHAVIRGELKSLLAERAAAVPILYGGSVNRGNASQLLESQDVDGLLSNLDDGHADGRERRSGPSSDLEVIESDH